MRWPRVAHPSGTFFQKRAQGTSGMYSSTLMMDTGPDTYLHVDTHMHTHGLLYTSACTHTDTQRCTQTHSHIQVHTFSTMFTGLCTPQRPGTYSPGCSHAQICSHTQAYVCTRAQGVLTFPLSHTIGGTACWERKRDLGERPQPAGEVGSLTPPPDLQQVSEQSRGSGEG